MTGKRTDTHRYVEEGKGQLWGWPREGSRDGQPGCSRGHSPHSHTSPSHLEERPVQSSPQGTETLLQDVSGYAEAAPGRGDRGEQTDTRAKGWSNPVGQDGTLVPAAQATSNFQLRLRKHTKKHILLCS